MERRQRAPGERSRRRVLGQAASLATVEGLEGLSIGRLAEATGMPKSSVYVLFGSKEQLQLATVDAARASFLAEVVTTALRTGKPGRERLETLCEGFLGYVQRRVFPGGCFFVATAAELGARPGRVRDRVATYQREWRDLLEQTAGLRAVDHPGRDQHRRRPARRRHRHRPCPPRRRRAAGRVS
jgi:AcrR family transcriptional regulator